MDIVLVNPGGRRSIYQALSNELAAIEPPLWAGLMARFVQIKGCSAEIVDADAEDLSPEQVAERVASRRPTLVAVVAYGHQPSASTQVMPAASAICSAIRTEIPDARILLVGGHVSALPEVTLAEEAVDFVCTGEGPYTLTDLIRALKSGEGTFDPGEGTFDPGEGSLDTGEDIFAAVRGLCYLRNGVTHRTQPAPLVVDLDAEMPEPAWELLPMDRYRAHNWHCFDGLQRQPYAAIYTTLGCPFKCSFCCIQAPFKEGERESGYKPGKNSYRRWNVDAVLAQIDTLVNKYGVRNIKIADEMFVLDRRHVLGICNGIIERGYDLNIWAYARVDTVRADMIDTLKRAGIHWLALGIEAANPRVLDDVDKAYTREQIVETVSAVREGGIYVIANYIFGLPEDDHDTMQQTLDLALELNCEFANFYCAMAYPGSPLYRDALAEGWALPEDWGGYSQHGIQTKPLPTRYLTAGEVLRFRDRAFDTYFSNPAYLHMIEQTFGIETVRHINEMASHTLERAHA
ncbi:MAG: cobalamin-dependent protein [Candidatus Hydrogenedentes bacterium]|nr:cobalamin-dependent protein [Candidatus Hydrogenedentota bacterium]